MTEISVIDSGQLKVTSDGRHVGYVVERNQASGGYNFFNQNKPNTVVYDGEYQYTTFTDKESGKLWYVLSDEVRMRSVAVPARLVSNSRNEH